MAIAQNKKLVLTGLIVLAALIIGFVAYDSYQKKQQLRSESLITAFTEMPQTLNPIFEQNATGLALIELLFDGLANRSGLKQGQYEDGLATDFIQDELDPSIYIVELDTEKSWHDDPNHKVSAQDVRFTYESIIKESNNSPLKGRISKLIKRIEVVTDDSIRVIFHHPIAPNIVRNVLDFKIIPAVYNGKAMNYDLRNSSAAKDFAQAPVGTGSFVLKSWEGNKISLDRIFNTPVEQDEGEEDEMGVKNHLMHVDAILVHDMEKQVKMLIDGKIDLMLETNVNVFSKLDESGLKHSNYTPLHFYGLAFNMKSDQFKNAPLRTGIAKAIDKRKLASLIWPEDVSKVINNGPFPHNDDKRYRGFKDHNPYNPSKASKLLKNYKDSKVTLLYKEEASNIMKKLADQVALNLKEYGIDVAPKGLGMAFDTQLSNGTFEIALVKHSDFSDGYNISKLYHSLSIKNITGLKSKRVDKLLAAWENTAFWKERLPLAIKVHEKLSSLSPYTYLFTIPTRAYYSDRLKNVTVSDPYALLAGVEKWEYR